MTEDEMNNGKLAIQNMQKQSEAIKIIDKIEGTAIADLQSLVDLINRSRTQNEEIFSNGQLNFALCLIALVICETCGFYFTGASKAICESGQPRDVGTYIMQFVQKYFSRDSSLKHLDKVMADYLRHALVHGYGSYNPKIDFDLSLFISLDPKDQVRATRDNEKQILNINSYSLAVQTIDAFSKFRVHIKGGDEALIDKILCARDCDIGVNDGVKNQFYAVFNRLSQ